VSAYPLALNIISDCWILFAVIWLVAAFWTKRIRQKFKSEDCRLCFSNNRGNRNSEIEGKVARAAVMDSGE
jgi:hypothetical protein